MPPTKQYATFKLFLITVSSEKGGQSRNAYYFQAVHYANWFSLQFLLHGCMHLKYMFAYMSNFDMCLRHSTFVVARKVAPDPSPQVIVTLFVFVFLASALSWNIFLLLLCQSCSQHRLLMVVNLIGWGKPYDFDFRSRMTSALWWHWQPCVRTARHPAGNHCR